MPLYVLGDLLGLLALAVVVAAGWLTWRRPLLGLGVLVAGMAFHNFLIMVLLRLGTSHVLVRVVQGWKEAILALLLLIAGLRVLRAYRERRIGRPIPLDWVAAAFLLLTVIYLVVPSGVLHGHTNLQQRLVAFRLAALIPILYAFGRTYYSSDERDLAGIAWMMLGAGALVGAFGMFELLFVPTPTWINWGVNDFSAWLGFHYNGPLGLPENFFQTLSGDTLLRRMVSTFVSPLGIAYTGLLVVPLTVVLIDRQSMRSRAKVVAIVALALLIVGILFSLTRLAIVGLAGEAVLLAIVMRRPVAYWLAPIVVACAFVMLVIYPQAGPIIDPNLLFTGFHSTNLGLFSDPSFLEHLRTVLADLKVAVKHPLGDGLGSAGTSALRFAVAGTASADYAPGESAILSTFVDTGILGGVLFLALYVLGLFESGRAVLAARRNSLEWALPMTAFVGGLAMFPIALTNDVWGDLTVTFLLWWAIGYSATLAAQRKSVSWAELIRSRRQPTAS